MSDNGSQWTVDTLKEFILAELHAIFVALATIAILIATLIVKVR